MQLSEHFTLEEATLSSTALRSGIDNGSPSAEVISNAKVAAAGMEQVRKCLGVPIHIDSWIRCEALERILCEKDFQRWCAAHGKDAATAWPEYFARKAHPKGFAVDFTAAGYGTPTEIARVLKGSGIKFDQLILEGTWVHISFDPALRQQVLSATFTNGTPNYTNGVA